MGGVEHIVERVHLAVHHHMGVHIDQSGGDELVGQVDDLCPFLRDRRCGDHPYDPVAIHFNGHVFLRSFVFPGKKSSAEDKAFHINLPPHTNNYKIFSKAADSRSARSGPA